MTPLARLQALLDSRAPTAAYDPAPWAAWLSEHGDQTRELIEAVTRLVEDEESQEGGWGPDVTMLHPTRQAVAPFLREQP